jgi:hypothetical protein
MSKTFLVYQHLRKDTGAIFYVGKGTPKRAVSSVGRNKHWKSIVKKSDGFSVEIVFNNLSEDDAFRLEAELILAYRSSGLKLANVADGGGGCSGYKHSDEMKAYLAEKSKGNKSRTGMKPSKEHIAKMVASRDGYKHNVETKHKLGTKVYCKTNGVTYDTQTEASLALGVCSTAVSMCCRGLQKKTRSGFEFEYADGETKRPYRKKELV